MHVDLYEQANVSGGFVFAGSAPLADFLGCFRMELSDRQADAIVSDLYTTRSYVGHTVHGRAFVLEVAP